MRFGPIYGRADMPLFNHLPMVLGALGRLGAPRQAMRLQLDHWAPLSRPAQADGPAAPAVAQALTSLFASPESQAFHVAIRLAYALKSGHAGELASALKTCIDLDRPLGDPPRSAQGSLALRDAIDQVRADDALTLAPMPGTLITTRMQRAAALPGFDRHVASPHLSMEALAEASLAVYLPTHGFAALHLITGTLAIRELLEAAASRGVPVDQDQVLRSVWRAWLAAYVSMQRPAPAWDRVHAGEASEADWTRALPALSETLNDHRIKLADAAREEWRHRGWPGYALCLQPAGAAA
ncbi:questin oxidase family protein [Roseateles amylovorans]